MWQTEKSCFKPASVSGLQRPVWRLKQQISVHADIEAISDGHLDCGLNVEIPARDLTAEPGKISSSGAARDFAGAWIDEHSAAVGLQELKRHAKNTR